MRQRFHRTQKVQAIRRKSLIYQKEKFGGSGQIEVCVQGGGMVSCQTTALNY